MSSFDSFLNEKVYKTEEFDDFLDKCDERMKKYFEIEKRNIEVERKYLRLKKKYDELMADFDDFFKFYVKKVNKEREKLYEMKYDRLIPKRGYSVCQLIEEGELCSIDYCDANQWLSLNFDEDIENIKRFLRDGRYNIRYEFVSPNPHRQSISKFLEFGVNEKMIGFYCFYRDQIEHLIFYTNYGNVLFLFGNNREQYQAFVEKLNFKIPPAFINLINTVVLNFHEGRPENTEQRREGKPNMTFNTLVNLLKQIKYITEN